MGILKVLGMPSWCLSQTQKAESVFGKLGKWKERWEPAASSLEGRNPNRHQK